MLVLNYSDGSGVEVQRLHVPICSTIIFRQGWLYTCSDDQARRYIGQDVIDTIVLKCNTKSAGEMLRTSFEYDVGWSFILKSVRCVCSQTMGNRKRNAENVFFSELEYYRIVCG